MSIDKFKKRAKKLLGPQLMEYARYVRTFFLSCFGKSVYCFRDIKLLAESAGGRPDDGYGAWHVATDSLSSASIIYSAGIGDDISFDLALISRLKCRIHAMDPTPESHFWLSKQTLPPELILHKFGLAVHDGVQYFHPAAIEGWVSHSIFKTRVTKEEAIALPVKRISTIMKELGHTRIDLLKMDIEGAEYDVLDDLLRSKIACHQLLIEFHHRSLQDGVGKTRAAVEELRKHGYRLYHMTGNGEEFSFIK